MTAILDSLRSSQQIRQSQRWNEQDAQRITGVLTNYQGFTSGVSMNSNGNRVYVGLGGGIDNTGSTFYSKVVNAWIDNTNGTFQPGEPVTLRYAREELRYYVTGINSVALASAGGSMQFYNPTSPERMFIDSGFVLDYLSRPVIADGTSTLIEVKPGVLYYYKQNQLTRHEFDGVKVDIASYVASSGNHNILQLWIDPVNDTVAYTQSSNIAEATAFSSAEWLETLSGAGDFWLPIQAYEMTDTSAVSVTQGDLLRDNRPIYTLPNTGGGEGDIGYPNPVVADITLSAGRELIVIAPFEVSAGASFEIEAGASLVTLPIGADEQPTPVIVTANYTITALNRTVLVDASAGDVTITLPDSNTVTSKQFNVKVINTTGGNVSIATTSSQLIDDGTTAELTLYESLKIEAVNGGWYIL